MVRKADASKVTPEDLHSTELYQLVAPFTHVFSSAEKRMLTFERETLGMYLAVDKWRKLIAKAAGRFKPVAAGGVHKVVLMMDNTTATSKWMSLGVPISLDHTSAKGQKDSHQNLNSQNLNSQNLKLKFSKLNPSLSKT